MAERRVQERTRIKGHDGFTLVEIIAVLALLGILAVVAMPRYVDMMDSGRRSIGESKVAEMEGGFNLALASYRLKNAGNPPPSGSALLDHYNAITPVDVCSSTPATDQNDTEYACSGAGSAPAITITVSAVRGVSLSPAITGTYSY